MRTALPFVVMLASGSRRTALHAFLNHSQHRPHLRPRSFGAIRATRTEAGEEGFAPVGSLEIGDVVRLKESGLVGKVQEKKGGGWWSVQVDQRTVSVRRLNLVPVLAEAAAAPSSPTSRRQASHPPPSLSERRANASFAAAVAAPVGTSPSNSLEAGIGSRRRRQRSTSMDENDNAFAAAPAAPAAPAATAAATAATAAGTAVVRPLPGSSLAAAVKESTAGAASAVNVVIRQLDDPSLPHVACKQWVVFSDLHVSTSSLDICLQVLDAVNEEASRREACGVFFLGDFWQVRGSIRVELLNAVMDRLSRWKHPVVMIPGNHDQVTLGGAVHSLSPLRFSFASPSQAVILSEPTLFLGALWLPHERDPLRMRAALTAAALAVADPENPRNPVPRAIFCHADVRGATTNGGSGSRAALEAAAFPPGVPVFSGHYHKPHVVGAPSASAILAKEQETFTQDEEILAKEPENPAQNRQEDAFPMLPLGVRYVGSPYQTGLAEAGQQKALLVLEAGSWREIETVPLSLGRRHFRLIGEANAVAVPARADARKGDRVVWTVADVRAGPVAAAAEELRGRGVEVELRELPRRLRLAPVAAKAGDSAGTDDGAAAAATAGELPALTPSALFSQYLALETSRNITYPPAISAAGFALIDELLGSASATKAANGSSSSSSSSGIEGEEADVVNGDHGARPLDVSSKNGAQSQLAEARRVSLRSDRHTDLRLQSVRLKNFGPFRDELTYPLDDRGVVLVRGVNLDDSGADSNGAGKTTLAVAPLWALTGSFDVRPVNDGRVSDVVHDGDSGGDAAGSGGGGGGGGRRGSGVAEVTLSGELNGEELVVTRRKGARVNQLFVRHGGRDLTRQAARETQQVLEEELGLSPAVLARAIFQGQHQLHGLLESTDARLKEGLALLVPMDLWAEAAAVCRRRAAAAVAAATAAAERRCLREADAARLATELAAARAAVAACRAAKLRHTGSGSGSSYGGGGGGGINAADAGSASNGALLEEINGGDIIVEGEDILVGPPPALSDSLDVSRGPETAMAAEATILRARQHAEEARKDMAAAETAAAALRRDAAAALLRTRKRAQTLAANSAAAAERALTAERDKEAALDASGAAVQAAIAASGRVNAVLNEIDSNLLPPWGRPLSALKDEDVWGTPLPVWAGTASAKRRASETGTPRLSGEEYSGGGGGGFFLDAVAGGGGDTQLRGAEEVSARSQEHLANRNRPPLPAPPAWWVAGAEELERRRAAAAAAREAALAAAADAEAALRQVVAVLREHDSLAFADTGECHTCGQHVDAAYMVKRGRHLAMERGEALWAREAAAEEAGTAEARLALSQTAADVWDRAGMLDREAAVAFAVATHKQHVAGDFGRLCDSEKEAAAAAEGEARRAAEAEAGETAAWESRMQAAEAIVALHRDKQTMAQRALTEAAERLGQLRLEHQEAAAQRRSLDDALGAAKKALDERQAAAARVDGELRQLQKADDSAAEQRATFAALAEHMGVRGVQNFVFRDAVQQLESNVARYLDVLSDGALRLSLSLDGDRVEKRVFVRAADGNFRQRSLSQLSGGQWRRGSIALELAFAELARQRSRFSCNLVVLDEVLSQLDAYGRTRVGAVLRGLIDGEEALPDDTEDEEATAAAAAAAAAASAAGLERSAVAAGIASLEQPIVDAHLGTAAAAAPAAFDAAVDSRAAGGASGEKTGGERRRGVYSTVLVILQEAAGDELEEVFDQFDEVTKQGDRSTVRVDPGVSD